MGSNLKFYKFHGAEVIFLITLITLCLFLIPNVTVPIIITVVVSYLFVQVAYNYSLLASNMGRWVIMVVTMLLGVGVVLNAWYFTSYLGGTFDNPVLINSDSSRQFNCALSLYSSGTAGKGVVYYGFPLLVAMIWKVTGVTILVPLLINYILTLASVVITAFVAWKALYSKVSHSASLWCGNMAMLLTAACCAYLGSGTVVLKEPSLYFGVVLMLYVIAGFMDTNRPRCSVGNMVTFTVGASFVVFNRAGFLYIIILGLLMFITRYSFKKILTLCVISVALLVLAYNMHEGNALRDAHIISGNVSMNDFISYDTANGSHSFYNEMMKGYYSFPVWKKVLYLPITMSVQYFVPFVWNYSNSVDFGLSQVYSYFGFPWYCVGGIIIFYLLYTFRYRPRPDLWRWSLMCLISFMAVAYISAGTVARYYLPFIPAYTVIATYALERFRSGQGRMPFIVWSVVYVCIVGGVLITCYELTA